MTVDQSHRNETTNGQRVSRHLLPTLDEYLDIENAKRISEQLSQRLIRSRLFKCDIVFPCVGTVGKALLIEEDNNYHINQDIAKIAPMEKVSGLFLALLLISYYAYHQIIHFNTSVAQPNVLVRSLRRFMIPAPLYEEQMEICNVVIKKMNEVDTLIEKYIVQIKLREPLTTPVAISDSSF